MPAIKYGTCQVIAQVTLAGVQDVRVRAFGRVEGWTMPYISVRIGQVLVNIEDRAALAALIEATQAAAGHSDIAFGPVRRPAA